MSDKVVVDFNNCEEVAKKIVEFLNGKKFNIVSFLRGGIPENRLPDILDGMTLFGGYSFLNGKMSIKLRPTRQLFWDLTKESVTVVFTEGGDLIVERVISNKKTLYRVVVITF